MHVALNRIIEVLGSRSPGNGVQSTNHILSKYLLFAFYSIGYMHGTREPCSTSYLPSTPSDGTNDQGGLTKKHTCSLTWAGGVGLVGVEGACVWSRHAWSVKDVNSTLHEFAPFDLLRYTRRHPRLYHSAFPLYTSPVWVTSNTIPCLPEQTPPGGQSGKQQPWLHQCRERSLSLPSFRNCSKLSPMKLLTVCGMQKEPRWLCPARTPSRQKFYQSILSRPIFRAS